MAALIRMPGETDAEYQRRCRPLLEMVASSAFRRHALTIVDNNNAITRHLRIGELRRSCGVTDRAGDTFKWDVSTGAD